MKIIKRIILNLYEKKFIITPTPLIPVQAQLPQVQEQEVVSTHPQEIAPTQVQVVPHQAQQIHAIESHMRQVVQCHAQQIASQVKKVLPPEVIQVEDMDISP